MRTAYIIERDQKMAADIEAALQGIDPKLVILKSENLEGFYNWLKSHVDKTSEEHKKAEIHLALIVSDIEFLGPRYYPLIEKARKMFHRKALCPESNLTPVVLTAFDSPDLDHTQIESRVISNVIFKPFDKPILDQHLRIALAGTEPVRESTVFRQQIKTTIEMIKDVHLTKVSEIGFITDSNRKIEVGQVSKYYSPWFVNGTQSSVLARCISCEPSKNKKDSYITEFQFVGLNNAQGQNLRRVLFKKPVAQAPKMDSKLKPIASVIGVFLSASKTEDSDLRDSISGKFGNVEPVSFHEFEKFLHYIDPSQIKQKSDPTKSIFRKLNPLKMFISKTGKILGFNIEPDAESEFFGFILSEVIGAVAFFKEHLHFQDRERWESDLKSPGTKKPGKDSVYFIKTKTGEYNGIELIKSASYNHKSFGDCLEVDLRELGPSEVEIYLPNKPLRPSPIQFVIISEKFLTEENAPFWGQLLEILKKQNRSFGAPDPEIFLVAAKTIEDERRKMLAKTFRDIIYLPLERLYLLKRLKAIFSNLQEKSEAIAVHITETNDVISVANPVELTDISEAGLSMTYYREISFGSFRRFRFASKNETEDPVFIAVCHHSEDNKKGGFAIQFVFFAVTDRYLKHIRKWIKDVYILTKQGQGS